MFESDCWLDWDPDPERAVADADASRESFASLSKSQILDLMAHAKGGREWEFLQEFFLDVCTPEELAVGTEEFIKSQYGVFGFEELCFLEGAIELALQRRLSLIEARPRPSSEGVQAYPLPPAGPPASVPIAPPGTGGDEFELPRPVAS